MSGMFDGCVNFNQANMPANMPEESQEEKPFKTYATVSKLLLEEVSIEINNNSTAYDLINLEDINVFDYLKENSNNIVFLFNNNFYICDKDTLKNLCNNENSVKYNCNQVYRVLYVSPDMFDTKTPYLLGNAFGCPCGLLEISKLKTIIESEDQMFVISVFNPSKVAASTVSLQMLLPNPNAVSASHCQEGQGETINNILKIILKPKP